MSIKSKAGFTLRDLVMPVALLFLAGCAAGHYYTRHARAQRESQVSQVTRELFDCEPDELMAKAFTPAKAHRDGEAAPKEIASAPRTENLARGPGFKRTKPASRAPAPRKPMRQKPPSPTKQSPGEAPRPAVRSVHNGNGVAALPGRTAAVAPARRPQALANEYDRRCQALMDEIY